MVRNRAAGCTLLAICAGHRATRLATTTVSTAIERSPGTWSGTKRPRDGLAIPRGCCSRVQPSISTRREEGTRESGTSWPTRAVGSLPRQGPELATLAAELATWRAELATLAAELVTYPAALPTCRVGVLGTVTTQRPGCWTRQHVLSNNYRWTSRLVLSPRRVGSARPRSSTPRERARPSFLSRSTCGPPSRSSVSGHERSRFAP